MHRQALAALFAVALTLAASAEQERRSSGVHQHGHGKLNIAIEGSRISMELESPGADIVGFEHPAATPEQKTKVADGKRKLSDPLALFKLPVAAGCKVVRSGIEIGGNHGVGRVGDSRANGAHAEQAKDKNEMQHSEAHATYELECKAASAITGIGFDYFKVFPNAQELEVSIVTPKGQSRHEVSRDKPQLDLGGAM